MTEIFQEAFKGYNLPLTIMLGVVGTYWLVALFGLVDFESADASLGLDSDFDVDVDTDVDLDVDTDFETDLEAGADAGGDSGLETDGSDHAHHASHSPNAFQSVPRFLGASDAPIMFVLSLFALYVWSFNLIGNFYFNKAESNEQANILLVASAIGAFLLTKISVRPLRPVMKLMRTASKNAPVIGTTGTVRSAELTDAWGQVEVIQKGASLLLNARLSEGCDSLKKGAKVLVVARDEDRDLYIARPLEPKPQENSL